MGKSGFVRAKAKKQILDTFSRIKQGATTGYLPHFAGFRMVAESPNYDDLHYWAASDSARADVLCLLKRAGAQFAVSDSVPDRRGPEWTRLGAGRYALRTLADACPPATVPSR